MEKLMRLPPGFRFYPTDEELVVQYLKRKALGCPLPAAVIPEVNLGKYDPWDLLPTGCYEGEKYFFTHREAKYRKGSGTNKRAMGSGYWKATGEEKPVVGTKHREVVGMKRMFVYYQGKLPRGVRTDWIMHEYRLVINLETMPFVSPSVSPAKKQLCLAKGEEWVVCRIFMKKRAPKRDDEISHYNHYNLQVQNERDSSPSSPPPSSSSFSCVTDLSNEDCSNGEEASSNLIA